LATERFEQGEQEVAVPPLDHCPDGHAAHELPLTYCPAAQFSRAQPLPFHAYPAEHVAEVQVTPEQDVQSFLHILGLLQFGSHDTAIQFVAAQAVQVPLATDTPEHDLQYPLSLSVL